MSATLVGSVATLVGSVATLVDSVAAVAEGELSQDGSYLWVVMAGRPDQ